MNNPNERLPTKQDKLWYFAQIERGIEDSSLDRETKVGSGTVISKLSSEVDTEYKINNKHHIKRNDECTNGIIVSAYFG